MFDFEPIRQDRRKRLIALRKWDGDQLPPLLMAEPMRELDRLELAMAQLATLEAERDGVLQSNQLASDDATPASGTIRR